MFAKLLKHEFKSCSGLMGLLCLASLGIGVADGFILRHLIQAAERMLADDTMEAVLAIVFAFSFLALFAFALTAWIYLCVQFYKRKFTDQGYLTFTLPVRSWQIYLTSLLNFLIWCTILSVALIAAFGLIFLIGFMGTQTWEEFVRNFRAFDMQEMLPDMDFVNPLYYIVNTLSSVMIMMNCIVLGSVLAKKHKVLAAVGSYYITSMVMSTASAWLLNLEYISDPILAIERMQWIGILLSGAVSFGGAVLAIWLMEKKLNLP